MHFREEPPVAELTRFQIPQPANVTLRRHQWYILKCIYLMRFDWDESKNRINRAKHGIDFAFARIAFDDPFAITIQDRDVSGEQRYQLIGAVYSRVILVAHAVATAGPGEDEETIRIISARKATRLERKRYEENHQNDAAN